MAEAAVATAAGAARRGAAVIRSSLLSMLAIAALGITRLIHSALVARDTDKPTYALIGVLIGATMTAGLFLPGGLSSAASKFISYHLGKGNPAAARRVYQLLSYAGYAASAALGLIVGGWALAYSLPLSDAIAVGLLTIAFSLYSIEKSALYGFDRVAAYVRLELIGSVVAIAATVIVVAGGWNAYLLPLTLGYTVLTLGAWFLLRRPTHHPPPPDPTDPPGNSTGDAVLSGARTATPVSPSRGESVGSADTRELRHGGGRGGRHEGGLISRGEKREIVGYVALASVGGLASAGLLSALPALAEIYTPRAEVAYFAAAVALVAPLYFLPRALGMALFPAMANAHGAGDLDTVRRHADLSTRALFTMLAPLFAFAMLLSRPILSLVFGVDFTPGAIVLQVLLAATYLMVTQVAAVNALSSGSPREVRVPVFSAVAGCVVGVLATIPLGIWLGGMGVGIAYLIAAMISASGPLRAVAVRHGLDWIGPISRSMAVVLAGLGISGMVDTVPVTRSGWWWIDIAAAVITAGLAALVLRRDIRQVIGGRKWSGGVTSGDR